MSAENGAQTLQVKRTAESGTKPGRNTRRQGGPLTTSAQNKNGRCVVVLPFFFFLIRLVVVDRSAWGEICRRPRHDGKVASSFF